MPFIKTIPPGKTTGETAEVYRHMGKMSGISRISRIVQVFSVA